MLLYFLILFTDPWIRNITDTEGLGFTKYLTCPCELDTGKRGGDDHIGASKFTSSLSLFIDWHGHLGKMLVADTGCACGPVLPTSA